MNRAVLSTIHAGLCLLILIAIVAYAEPPSSSEADYSDEAPPSDEAAAAESGAPGQKVPVPTLGTEGKRVRPAARPKTAASPQVIPETGLSTAIGDTQQNLMGGATTDVATAPETTGGTQALYFEIAELKSYKHLAAFKEMLGQQLPNGSSFFEKKVSRGQVVMEIKTSMPVADLRGVISRLTLPGSAASTVSVLDSSSGDFAFSVRIR
ncbi:MAG: hypothetical protein AB7F66_15080 [Bacteriovoracia bacterium]